MNTIKIFILITALFSLNACNSNLDDIMSADDIAALQVMETSYIAAVEANSSLASYIESTGITNDQTCFNLDSTYHQNDSIFEANHMMYSHNNSGDDHDTNSWSMGSGWMSGSGHMGHSGVIGHGYNSSFCTSDNLDLMDSLMLAHESYHPLADNGRMSIDDLAAKEAMDAAFAGAIMYNDSLSTYVQNTGISNDSTCFYFDEMYHQNDSIFEANHNIYSHNNDGDDHGSGEWSMGSGWMSGGHMGNSGHMGNGYNYDFCTADNLDLMDSLMNTHEDYHPEN